MLVIQACESTPLSLAVSIKVAASDKGIYVHHIRRNMAAIGTLLP
jgi:hypothetical protein